MFKKKKRRNIKQEFPDYKQNGLNEAETIKYHLFHDLAWELSNKKKKTREAQPTSVFFSDVII